MLDDQPRQWVQLAGNHEAQYLTPPKFHWPERLPEDDLETLTRPEVGGADGPIREIGRAHV